MTKSTTVYARRYREKKTKTEPLYFSYISCKDRARKKGIPFDIELSDLEVPDTCPVLGVPMVRKTPYAPSIDRIIPDAGYVRGNVQVISKKANTMKQDATRDELLKFADWIINDKNIGHPSR